MMLVACDVIVYKKISSVAVAVVRLGDTVIDVSVKRSVLTSQYVNK